MEDVEQELDQYISLSHAVRALGYFGQDLHELEYKIPKPPRFLELWEKALLNTMDKNDRSPIDGRMVIVNRGIDAC